MPAAINVPGVQNLTASQIDAVNSAAVKLGMDPDWLFTVISFETGGSFSPTVRNAAGSGAFGLIQFMPSTARNLLGTATNDEAVRKGMAMSFNEQLEKMVIPYLRGPKYKSVEDVYLKIFYPVAMGKPGNGYPWCWSVYRWLEGSSVSATPLLANEEDFARQLASFLRALQSLDTRGAPDPGEHNFGRGGPVGTYDEETREAISALSSSIDSALASAIWETALASKWQRASVWVHGDVAAGNLLVRDGRLAAVIDFGCCAVGDPACDLTIAWTFFSGSARKAFADTLSLDDATWQRARGWALWKALIVACGKTGSPEAAREAWRVLGELLADR